MKKVTQLLIGLAVCTMCSAVFAAEQVSGSSNTAPNTVATQEKKNDISKYMPSNIFLGEISVEEMDKRLKEEGPNDYVYLKCEPEKVLVFRALAKDRASCKQILYLSPRDEMIEVYTNDKKSFNQFWNTIRPYSSEWNLADGCQVACDKSPEINLGNNHSMYRIWYKKIEPENKAYRVERIYVQPRPVYWPVSIGISWGHHRHYGHPGPRFGHRPPPHHRR